MDTKSQDLGSISDTSHPPPAQLPPRRVVRDRSKEIPRLRGERSIATVRACARNLEDRRVVVVRDCLSSPDLKRLRHTMNI